MPRRSSSPSRGFGGGRRAPPPPSHLPAHTRQPAPPAHPPPSAVGAAQPSQPGLFARMATTAVGVGIGSAVGHTVGAAIVGGGRSEPAPTQQDAVYQQQQQPYQPQSETSATPCQIEMRRFIECAQTQYDITLCEGLNEILRQCRVNNGLPLQWKADMLVMHWLAVLLWVLVTVAQHFLVVQTLSRIMPPWIKLHLQIRSVSQWCCTCSTAGV